MYRDLEKQEIADKFDEYIDETEGPMVSEFASRKDIRPTRKTIYSWAEKDDDGNYYDQAFGEIFDGLIERCRDKNRAELSRNGLTGKWKANVAIFLLQANHGMAERREIQGNPERPQQIVDPNEVADRIYQGMIERGEVEDE